MLQTNCLSVTHRYFPDARPSPAADWQYLDIWQAAQDHHRIVQLFKENLRRTLDQYRRQQRREDRGLPPAVFSRRCGCDRSLCGPIHVLTSRPPVRTLPEEHGAHRKAAQRSMPSSADSWSGRRTSSRFLSGDWFYSEWSFSYSLPLGLPVFESSVVSYEWGFWQRHIFDSTSDIPGPLSTDWGR